jgi:hypothetical protein
MGFTAENWWDFLCLLCQAFSHILHTPNALSLYELSGTRPLKAAGVRQKGH